MIHASVGYAWARMDDWARIRGSRSQQNSLLELATNGIICHNLSEHTALHCQLSDWERDERETRSTKGVRQAGYEISSAVAPLSEWKVRDNVCICEHHWTMDSWVKIDTDPIHVVHLEHLCSFKNMSNNMHALRHCDAWNTRPPYGCKPLEQIRADANKCQHQAIRRELLIQPGILAAEPNARTSLKIRRYCLVSLNRKKCWRSIDWSWMELNLNSAEWQRALNIHRCEWTFSLRFTSTMCCVRCSRNH